MVPWCDADPHRRDSARARLRSSSARGDEGRWASLRGGSEELLFAQGERGEGPWPRGMDQRGGSLRADRQGLPRQRQGSPGAVHRGRASQSALPHLAVRRRPPGGPTGLRAGRESLRWLAARGRCPVSNCAHHSGSRERSPAGARRFDGAARSISPQRHRPTREEAARDLARAQSACKGCNEARSRAFGPGDGELHAASSTRPRSGRRAEGCSRSIGSRRGRDRPSRARGCRRDCPSRSWWRRRPCRRIRCPGRR